MSPLWQLRISSCLTLWSPRFKNEEEEFWDYSLVSFGTNEIEFQVSWLLIQYFFPPILCLTSLFVYFPRSNAMISKQNFCKVNSSVPQLERILKQQFSKHAIKGYDSCS